jgi:hypothetical protein
MHDEIAEIAYVFGSSWWDHGYATEATAWLLDRIARIRARDLLGVVGPRERGLDPVLRRLGFTGSRIGDGHLLSYADGDLTFRRAAERDAHPVIPSG